MSLNSAMQTGVTGLTAFSTALTTISNNIANVNTTGYKTQETDFQDIVTGSTATAVANSGGVTAVERQTVTSTGTLTSTNSNLDLAVDGQGFFVVSPNSSQVSTSSSVLFTRDGSFSTDKSGYLVNSAGNYLEGWPVNADGTVTSDSSDLSKLEPINISNIGGTAEATTQVAVNANLDSTTPTTTYAEGTYDPTSPTESMSVYDASATPAVGTKPDVEISIPVSDSQGGQQSLTMSLLKTGANTWSYELWSPNIADASGNTTATGGLGQVSTGTLVFNTDGTLNTSLSTSNDLTTTPPTSGAYNSDLVIGASGSTDTPRWSDALGVAGQSIAISLGSSTNSGLSQDASDSITNSVTSNGTAFGNLTKVTVGDDGMVTAVFDNGVTRNIAQVALATFVNANGLTAVSGNAYQVSRDSGTYSLRTPGSGGSGTISPSTLEASTVDLSQEFTALITTQRAYSASSKIITTADQMMQELLSIKQ